MIEVEKKFRLSEDDKKRLLEGAEFLSTNVFTDVYYDTPDMKLTTQDTWLRERAGKFELKVPITHQGANKLIDHYDELQNDDQIREKLGLKPNKDLGKDLLEAGYKPFCTCKTERAKYSKGEFVVDLDDIDYGDWKYSLGEIELQVASEDEIAEAEKKILEYAEASGLEVIPVRGKVLEYLKEKSPKHYKALEESGVLKKYQII